MIYGQFHQFLASFCTKHRSYVLKECRGSISRAPRSPDLVSKYIPARGMSSTPYLVRETIPVGASCDLQIPRVLPFQEGKEMPRCLTALMNCHDGTTSVLLIERPVPCSAIGSLSARFKVSLSMPPCPREIFDLPD